MTPRHAAGAIVKGQYRIPLVTGTGKTYTAFQIIWRLRNARRKKRVLFPATSRRRAPYGTDPGLRPVG